MPADFGLQQQFPTGAGSCRLGKLPSRIDPIGFDDHAVEFGVGNFRRIGMYDSLPFHGSGNDAPRLAGSNHLAERIVDPRRQCVLGGVRKADGRLAVFLEASTLQIAALVHFENDARSFDLPVDTAFAAWLIVFVVNSGDHQKLFADGQRSLCRPDFEPFSVPVEIDDRPRAGQRPAGLRCAAETAAEHPRKEDEQRDSNGLRTTNGHRRLSSVTQLHAPQAAKRARYTAQRRISARAKRTWRYSGAPRDSGRRATFFILLSMLLLW